MGWFDAKSSQSELDRFAESKHFKVPRVADPSGTLLSRLGSGGAQERPVRVGDLKRFLADIPDDWQLGIELEQSMVVGVPLPARSGNLVATPPAPLR